MDDRIRFINHSFHASSRRPNTEISPERTPCFDLESYRRDIFLSRKSKKPKRKACESGALFVKVAEIAGSLENGSNLFVTYFFVFRADVYASDEGTHVVHRPTSYGFPSFRIGTGASVRAAHRGTFRRTNRSVRRFASV